MEVVVMSHSQLSMGCRPEWANLSDITGMAKAGSVWKPQQQTLNQLRSLTCKDILFYFIFCLCETGYHYAVQANLEFTS